MSVYIKDMEMPRGCASCKISRRNGKKMICPFIWKCEWDIHDPVSADHRLDGCPLIPVPDHGRLIDADALRQAMYHEAFETDSPMQKWDSGCWIRYKMFERMEESAPTIIPADKEGEK